MPTNCPDLKPGNVIEIYYDVRDPSINRAMEPVNGLINELIPIGLACLMCPPLILAAMKYARDRKRSSSTG
jgi:hypothetical protein